MTNFKGTKGKWEVEFDTASLQKHIKCGNKYIAEVSFGNLENNSNAKLIAHAPEMLECIEYLLKELRYHGFNNSNSIYKAEELIKKATE